MDKTITRREENKQITTDISNFKEVTDTKEGKDTTYDFNVLIIQIKNVMRKQFHQKKNSFQNLSLSNFERNVIQKNINERNEIEKIYGISNLAAILKKTISIKDYVKEQIYSSYV